jgi:transcriptional regulator with XRE-family HTH domain
MLERLGRVAREARLEAGVTLIRMAATCGVSETTLSRFERGRHWPRRPDVGLIIAAYEQELGLPADELWRRAILP